MRSKLAGYFGILMFFVFVTSCAQYSCPTYAIGSPKVSKQKQVMAKYNKPTYLKEKR